MFIPLEKNCESVSEWSSDELDDDAGLRGKEICLLSVEFDNKYNNNDVTIYIPAFSRTIVLVVGGWTPLNLTVTFWLLASITSSSSLNCSRKRGGYENKSSSSSSISILSLVNSPLSHPIIL